MKTLTELGLEHGTDKASLHGYTDIYARYFEARRLEPLTLLEIGIAGGNSLRMWHSYFPNATIIGLDHNVDFVETFQNDCPARALPVYGEAMSEGAWARISARAPQGLDVLIDDGGHFSDQIILALFWAWPLLKPNGLYCIEDTHQVYVQENGVDGRLWSWLVGRLHMLNEGGLGQCGRPQHSDIAFIHVYKSLVIFGKR